MLIPLRFISAGPPGGLCEAEIPKPLTKTTLTFYVMYPCREHLLCLCDCASPKTKQASFYRWPFHRVGDDGLAGI